MVIKHHIVILVTLAMIIGCTPMDEAVVRKTGSSRGMEEPAKLASAQGRTEANPEIVLDPSMQSFIREHGAAIRRYAELYGFDWRLILSIVKQESGFTSDALSHKGALGLMQIMPLTGEQLAKSLELEGTSLPEDNLRAGVYYLKTLYDLFEGVGEPDRIKLTLAAYNAGIGRVYDAQELAAYLHDNPGQWQAIRDALPLLSKRFYTLHKNVWEQEKPKAGWFGNAKETIAYVERVIDKYDEYRLVLN
jgi:soluble lytic murein transglycosylase-like protein